MTLRDGVQIGCETFILFSVGGSVFYFVKGALRGSSIAGGVEEVTTNGARVRRRAAWFGVLTAIDGTMLHMRRVHGPVSYAIAWGGANALFSVNRGTRAAVREGLKGAAYSQVAGLAACGLMLLLQSQPGEESSSTQ